MSTIHVRALLAAITAALLYAAAVARPAEAAVTVPQTFADSGDYCLGQCNDILPAGENGTATLTQILANKLFGTQPKHAEDQLAPYADLADSYTGLTSGTLKKFFNDASFTVSPSDVESTIKPGGRSDVTIVRDKTGIPHVYGTTRAGTEFGAGYAAGQDRLWLMDVLRHLGRGQLSSFAGGAASNRALEQQFYQAGAYTEADREAQIQRIATGSTQGAKIYQDVLNYIAGINQYIADAKKSLSFPGEYDLTGNSDALGNGIVSFKPTDLIAMGTVISALFGSSSGNQLQSAIVKLAAEKQYGKAKGDAVWAGLRDENNTDAVTTIHDGSSFPYAASPANPVGVAMPDAGSVTAEPIVYAATGSAATAATKAAAAKTARTTAPAASNSKVKKAAGANNKGVLPANLLSAKHACPTRSWSARSTPRAGTRSPSSARRPATSRRRC